MRKDVEGATPEEKEAYYVHHGLDFWISPEPEGKHFSSRYFRITIKSSGECVVIIPKRMPMPLVKRFVLEKKDWIEKKQRMMGGVGL